MDNEEKIIKIIAKICKMDPADLSRETEYVKDLNILKSVKYYQLAVMLEEKFGVKVDYQKVKAHTIGETIDYIKSL